MSTFPSGPDATTPPPAAPPPQKKGLSGCAIAGIGCAIAAVLGLIVVILLIVAGGYWFVRQGPAFMQSTLTQEVQQSPLPPDEKQVFIDRIGEMTADYEAGQIDLEQYVRELEQLTGELEAAIQQAEQQGAVGGPPPDAEAPTVPEPAP